MRVVLFQNGIQLLLPNLGQSAVDLLRSFVCSVVRGHLGILNYVTAILAYQLIALAIGKNKIYVKCILIYFNSWSLTQMKYVGNEMCEKRWNVFAYWWMKYVKWVDGWHVNWVFVLRERGVQTWDPDLWSMIDCSKTKNSTFQHRFVRLVHHITTHLLLYHQIFLKN